MWALLFPFCPFQKSRDRGQGLLAPSPRQVCFQSCGQPEGRRVVSAEGKKTSSQNAEWEPSPAARSPAWGVRPGSHRVVSANGAQSLAPLGLRKTLPRKIPAGRCGTLRHRRPATATSRKGNCETPRGPSTERRDWLSQAARSPPEKANF